jgi:hypothetical protein
VRGSCGSGLCVLFQAWTGPNGGTAREGRVARTGHGRQAMKTVTEKGATWHFVVERVAWGAVWQNPHHKHTVSCKDHGDHVTASAMHPDGPIVRMIAQPEKGVDGSTLWVATAWVRGMIEGSSGLCSSLVDALSSAFLDTCSSDFRGGVW